MGRILHVSDIHFGAVNAKAAEAALEFARAGAFDLILVTGDITQNGRRREFADAAAWMKHMPEPVFVIPGNHDTPYWDLLARLCWPWRRWEEALGQPAHDHQFQNAALMVRAITTARGAQLRPNWSKGAIDLDQTRRAAEALSQAPNGVLRVIACHHPLIEMIGGPMTGDVRRGRAAAQVFADAGVDLVMTGHVHVPFALPIHLGDRCSYAVGAGTLSLRLRGSPPGFNVVEWDAREVRVQAMGWTGSHFEAGQTWSLPRRDAGAAAAETAAAARPPAQ